MDRGPLSSGSLWNSCNSCSWVRPNLGQSQEPWAASRSPVWVQGPSIGAVLNCLPRHISQKLDRRCNKLWLGTWTSTHQGSRLTRPCVNTSPSNSTFHKLFEATLQIQFRLFQVSKTLSFIITVFLFCLPEVPKGNSCVNWGTWPAQDFVSRLSFLSYKPDFCTTALELNWLCQG